MKVNVSRTAEGALVRCVRVINGEAYTTLDVTLDGREGIQEIVERDVEQLRNLYRPREARKVMAGKPSTGGTK